MIENSGTHTCFSKCSRMFPSLQMSVTTIACTRWCQLKLVCMPVTGMDKKFCMLRVNLKLLPTTLHRDLLISIANRFIISSSGVCDFQHWPDSLHPVLCSSRAWWESPVRERWRHAPVPWSRIMRGAYVDQATSTHQGNQLHHAKSTVTQWWWYTSGRTW